MPFLSLFVTGTPAIVPPSGQRKYRPPSSDISYKKIEASKYHYFRSLAKLQFSHF